ncbi:MAG: DUF721 domain-containing protein [Actinobacteria bacterium]|nr:DUF721 domain-containing protein [Actinomycetota bacterium]
MARAKKTRPLGEIVPEVLKRADKSGRRYGALAVNAWGAVAGDEIARHTRGYALRENREMVVFVDTAAWASQLSLMSEDLKERLNAHLGENAVRSLRFTVSRKVKEETEWRSAADQEERFYDPEIVAPSPLDEIELAQAAQVADAVRDPELKDAALRAMVRDLEQKKGARRGVTQRPLKSLSDGREKHG